MRCPTEEIDIDGQKVVINVSDFDPETMKRWDYSDSEAASIQQASGPLAPAPVAPVAPEPKMRI